MPAVPEELTFTSLSQIWHQSRDSTKRAGRPGVDKITAKSFSNKLSENIASLSKDVREDNFSFSALYPTFITKGDGTDRVICVPTVRDRLLQRALVAYLEKGDRLKIRNPISYGFHKGLSVRSACEEAVKQRKLKNFVLKVDIVKFFDTVDRNDAKNLVQKAVSTSRIVRRLVIRAIDVEVSSVTPEIGERIAAAGITFGKGLRQGMPLSPILSNLFLKRLDQTLWKKNISAVRYVDDILVFGASQQECEEAYILLAETLAALKCSVYPLGTPSKAQIYGPRQTVEFLGVDIKFNGKEYVVSAPFKKLTAISAKMMQLASMRQCIEKRRTFGSVSRSLESYVGGYSGAISFVEGYDDFIGELHTLREKALEALASELLTAKVVANLSMDAKQVLGLAPY